MPNFYLSHKRGRVAGCMLILGSGCGRPRFEANAPRSGPRTAGFRDEVAGEPKSAKARGHTGRVTGATGYEADFRLGDTGRTCVDDGCRTCADAGAQRYREV